MPSLQELAKRNPKAANSLDQIDPNRVYVVEVDTGTDTIRRDCYAPGEEIKMFRLLEDEVELQVLQWDHTTSMHPEVKVEWVGTGISNEDVERIRIFEWPGGGLVKEFKEMD